MSKKRLFGYVLLLQAFVSHACCAQARKIDSLFKAFRENVLIEQAQHHGRIVWDDETRVAYYSLMSACPADELVKYTDDSNAAVRAEIFGGLANKSDDLKMLRDILAKHMADTATFTSAPTDVVITLMVKEYMQLIVNVREEGRLQAIDYDARRKAIENEPHLIIPGLRHYVITKNALLKIDSLAWSTKDFRIISFDLFIKGATYRTKNVFTKRMKEYISSLKPGERIYLDEIKVMGPDHRIRQLGSSVLTVK